ncbi:MAG: PDZ domain-containing protein, partial [Gammaproteobacteria bacterium]|nr:PDZ domain-containing protein [Gammaproteobacteria bacterium]
MAALFIVVADTVVAGEEEQWEQVVDQVASAVLSIRVDATRAFDTEWNSSTQATGFIVDAEKGIVLTNRHVVQPGPVIATGGFLNREEVELRPIYRDPVHDFGFYQYDPKALSFNNPAQLTLKPGLVQIGKEIRVIGNDGGEQLSILVGTIARLDREAPRYGRGGYNDFNTYYIQAASGISGGSSGSPVVDINGNVIALGAGASRKNAASFFLPLDRVARALKYVREGQPVPRGTLQTTFLHQPFDELRRLGLSLASEAAAREGFPQGVGLLIVSQVIPGSPAEGVLQPGDVLLRVEDEMIFSFIQLDRIWDSHVGGEITLQLERGGQPLEVTLPVQDLHAITPDSYIEFGDAVVHNLSYQQARNYNVPVSGVYVAIPGYVLGNEAISRGTVITALNNTPTQTLDAFEAIL